ncbi:hypothetical protein NTJ56_10295 [Burkholderia contaminans]|uniref:hypothetical protein n=1 Tax=Burkholderia contaminans TaxID=488447 RepID=UPI001CF1A914|nr:hypothetical protein [Burkholderia contaminans]MCA7916800.1 hypothetical protein [Burkholderia contaminans]UUX35764.1 hypothetical protein NTJ56_10295 [Burkholderia contaminans]
MGLKKQRNESVLAAANQYFLDVGVNEEADRNVLSAYFLEVDSLHARLTALAKTNIRPKDKDKILVQLTPETTLSPQATGSSPDYFRITTPMSLLHRMRDMTQALDLQHAPYAHTASWPLACAMVASMAAFGHELNHAFSGHVALASDAHQESNSDFRAGGMVAAWLQRDNLRRQALLDTTDQAHRPDLVLLAFTLLCLIFGPATPGHVTPANYPEPANRFALLMAGYVFLQKRKHPAELPFTMVAIQRASQWIPSAFAPLGLEATARILLEAAAKPAADSASSVEPASTETRRRWYQSAVLLRPIAKLLKAALKRDAERGR